MRSRTSQHPRAGGDAVAPAAEQLPAHRFTQDAVLRMVDADTLKPEDRIELIHGEIVDMLPTGPRHAEYVDRLLHLFADLMREARVRVQGSLDLGPLNLVVPDLMLLREKAGGYSKALPGASDVLLLVEVAEASLVRDSEVKARLYAAAGIGDYWIVDVDRQVIIVHREPQQDRYDQVRPIKRADYITPLRFPQKRVGVGDLFG